MNLYASCGFWADFSLKLKNDEEMPPINALRLGIKLRTECSQFSDFNLISISKSKQKQNGSRTEFAK